jgi:CheY-like chemotaxis protein
VNIMAKVLLVEDDNNLREIYEARLQAEGYDIVAASDGEQALVVAKSEKPDLVISDVMMPKISGFEMLDILRNTDGLKDVKVIMLTALGQADDKSRADSLGANRYLVKSQVTLEDIVKTAHQLLDTEPVAPAPVAAQPVVPTPVAVPAPAVVTPVAAEPVVQPTIPVAPVAVEPVVEAPSILAAPVAEPVVIPTTPAEPIVAPAPVAAPEPAIAVDPVAQASAAVAESETSAQESADMAAQIESFVQRPESAIITPTSAPVVTETVPVEPTAQSDDAANDQTMNEAVDSLTAASTQKPSDVTAVEVSPAPAPTPSILPTSAASAAVSNDDTEEENETAQQADDAVTIAHKKVIAPLNDISARPDINALLAAEESKDAAAQSVEIPAPVIAAPTVAEPVVIPTTPAEPIVAPAPVAAQPVVPTPVAVPAPAVVTPVAAEPVVQPTIPVAPAPVSQQPEIDPNSITL